MIRPPRPVYERAREDGHAAAGASARLPPDELAEDVLAEMTNLTERDTRIPGTIFISTAMGQHGPRIKWFPDVPGRRSPCVILSIDPEPVVRDDLLPPHVSRPMIPLLQEWVRVNHEDLLRFWSEGETWDRRVVARFLDGLRPLSRS